MTQPLQSVLQAEIRKLTGKTTQDFNGDLHDLCSYYGIPMAPISGRAIGLAKIFRSDISTASAALNYLQANATQVVGPGGLFANGEPGAWYDPSDNTTLFSDTAGTTPVAQPGAGAQVVVGLMLDKSQGLALGSELITPEANRDFSSDTGYWTKEAGVTISGGTANWTATANSDLYRLNVLTVGKWYRITWTISSYTSGNFRLSVGGTTGAFRTAAGTYTETYYAASNGTFAITGQSSATGSVDNISVKEIAGNHARSYNSTTARPELSARVNLLTYSEQFDNAVWVKTDATVTPNAVVAPDGTTTGDALVTSIASNPNVQQTLASPQTGIAMVLSFYARAGTTSEINGQLFVNSGSPSGLVTVTGTIISGPGSIDSSGATSGLIRVTGLSSTQWTRIAVTGTPTATSGSLAGYIKNRVGASALVGDTTYIWGAQLVAVNQFPANTYQRIADQYTYDNSASFPRYLRFDGVDDGMSTPANLNLSSTDKATVFAGVRKLSDAAAGVLTELSANQNTNAGSFLVTVPTGANTEFTASLSQGNSATYNSASYTDLAAPITTVNSISFDKALSTDEVVFIRKNGANQSLTRTLNGNTTGNFGTYPLYIGARNNASLWFNGFLYSLLVRGAATDASTISATEQWIAGKTGISI